jgi:hypothetical protein
MLHKILTEHKDLLKKYDNMNLNELNNELCILILEIKKKNKIYEIEKIIKKKNTKNGIKYFVKWKGFTNKHNSWINNFEFI